MSSDTPRTDAAYIRIWSPPCDYDAACEYLANMRDLARELERENNALRAKVGELEQQLHALRLVCGTTDANKFQTVVDRQLAKIAELERVWAAVSDWRDARKRRCQNCDEGDESADCTCFDAIDRVRQAEKRLEEIVDAARSKERT